MPTAVSTRTISASPWEVWEVVGDPHHLPRWWPRVTRVEGVRDGEFTEVLTGRKGKVVRADFDVVELVAERRVVWSQQVRGTPFEGVLRSAVTEIELMPATGASGCTDVRIELRQELPGPLPTRGGGGMLAGRLFAVARFGSPLVRRAAASTVEQALEGLARAFGER